MPRPIHFEIHTVDPQRAIRFYSELFGWEFTSFGGGEFDYWTIKTGKASEPGIDGGLMRRMSDMKPEDIPDSSPMISYVVTVGVEDIDRTFAKAQELGARVALPKGPVKGMGWVAYIKDTEGNVVGLFQLDTNAA